MTFTERFGSFVCPGDTITCEAGGFTIMAAIVLDDCPDAPDQRQDGFWPSLYINDPGFIGPGNGFRERFAKAQAEAETVMEGWRKGDWFYCGIVLSVALEGVTLDTHAASLWGVEANYPGSDNAYLTEVANDLLPEALDTARAVLARLRAIPAGEARV
ncbi:hypothetical protein [Hyphomonas sp. GM-8P]|uniref:hypothetical protein n=1 Tax=Hyphomonas sp. GM-8P TaxID=1280945 RepID=UPI000DBFB067|nr:hypothetical protein [Hyphomonas sp. GM-8P]RAN36574.1 hypothetical protein HY26_18865 [Hyphomonas sp. GM-8P]